MLFDSRKHPLFLGIAFLLAVIVFELITILHMNSGIFTYTLDDPYIHMTLADHIWNWHYGINANEFSAPSSSIIWPFILALFPSSDYTPFLLNTLAAILTVIVFYKVLDKTLIIQNNLKRTMIISLLIMLLIMATNTIGLIFTGMEHSLQLLLVSLIAYGLIFEIESNRVASWLLFAIVMAPLVRYENLAISSAALLYLFLNKHYAKSVVVSVILIIFITIFSLFIDHLNLGFFPTSVLMKSSVVSDQGQLITILKKLKGELKMYPQSLRIALVAIMLSCSFFYLNGKKYYLAITTVFAVLLHLIAGSYDWYNRYEIYIWAYLLLISCYLMGGLISDLLMRDNKNKNLIQVGVLASVFICFSCSEYIYNIVTIPFAANNVYEQQYQMRRFAIDYYKKPIGVNDLGLVSVKNTNYVLDLWGLGSLKAYNYLVKYKQGQINSEWMDTLTKSYGVEFVMIYEKWFRSFPPTWIKIGDLNLGEYKANIIQPDRKMAFFALSEKAYQEIVPELKAFQKTLPQGVVFTFTDREKSSGI